MKYFYIFLAGIMLSHTGWSQKWKVSWKDEFNHKNYFNLNAWSVASFLGAKEMQNQRPMVKVYDGTLYLNAQTQKISARDRDFLFNQIQTKSEFGQGRIEIRARLPKESKCTPLIFFEENSPKHEPVFQLKVAFKIQNEQAMVRITSSKGQLLKTKTVHIPNKYPYNSIYALEYDDKFLKFFIDKKPHFVIKFSNKSQLIEYPLQVGLGFSPSNYKAQSTDYQQFLVDYVRYYTPFSDINTNVPIYLK